MGKKPINPDKKQKTEAVAKPEPTQAKPAVQPVPAAAKPNPLSAWIIKAKRMFAKKGTANNQLGEKKDVPKRQILTHGIHDVLLKGEFEHIRRRSEKKKKHRDRRYTTRGLLKILDLESTLEKAGLEGTDPKKITRNLLHINFAIFGAISLYYAVRALFEMGSFFGYIVFMASIWIGFFFLSLALLWLSYLFYLDMRIFKRTNEVEKVFPDFLQLASSNISAGMPIDRALWYAVRPNFGVLAKEIETVAKNTIAGQDLTDALQDFSKKYDSKVIQRSINLILEGLAAGGELADLLNKIALNIEETRILKRDMAANVMTYVIFITFATIVAAPALLGLSTQLLQIIAKVTSTIATENPSTSAGMFSFSFSSDAATIDNFRIFAFTNLTISSISAACIVNIIQKGRVKDGLYRIPLFIAISVVVYVLSSVLMDGMFANLI